MRAIFLYEITHYFKKNKELKDALRELKKTNKTLVFSLEITNEKDCYEKQFYYLIFVTLRV